MNAAISISGYIELIHIRNGLVISRLSVPNAVLEEAATEMASGLSNGSCTALSLVQFQLSTTGGSDGTNNNQKPTVSATRTAQEDDQLGAGFYECKVVASHTFTSTNLGSTYTRLASLKMGKGSGVSDFAAYASHTLSTPLDLEENDKVEINWYIGANNGAGQVTSQAIAELLATGSTSNYPSKVGYVINVSGTDTACTQSVTTATESLSGKKQVTYTSPTFTASDSGPMYTGTPAPGFYKGTAVGDLIVAGKDASGDSLTVTIAHAAQYILVGKLRIEWS